MIVMNWQTIATLSVGRMLNWIVVGIAMALFAEILLRLARRRNSGTRFAVWFSALLGIALIPLAAYTVPQPSLADGIARSRVLLPASWALYLLTAWVAVAAIGLFRIAFGLWQVHRLRQASLELPLSALDPLLRSRLQRRPRRRVRFYRSDAVRVPIAVGFFPAAIIFPTWTLNELSPAELDAVLLHELAHIDRWDDWTNLAQRIIGAIFFFNPAVWWIANQLTLEREMACDDLVVKETSNPHGYARCLVFLAEKSFVRRGLTLAQAAVTRMRQTTRRISQILDVNRPGVTTVWKPALALVASFSLASLLVVSRTPQLVAFEGSATRGPNATLIPVSYLPQLSSTSKRRTVPERQKETLVAASSGASRAALPKLAATSESSLRPLVHAARFIGKSESLSRAQLSVARTKLPKPATTSADAYFVVLQANYAPSGETFWTIRVVQLTVFHPNSSRTQQDFPPKSI
jgi:beta-lactamase regulating signal transducer with metallopeptidase domain